MKNTGRALATVATKMRVAGVGSAYTPRHGGRTVYQDGTGFNLDLEKTPGLLDQIYAWRRMTPNRARQEFLYNNAKVDAVPQQQFTIEIRVDYADKEKYDLMRKAARKAAQHLYATAELISDKVKPQIAIFSDDYFEGHKDIDLLDNTIERGLNELEAAGDDTAGGNDAVSDELLDALRDPDKAA